jgi:hypothetical protein
MSSIRMEAKVLLREFLSDILSGIPFQMLLKIKGKNLLLPLYHMVSNERIPYVIHRYAYRSIKQFQNDLDFLQKYFSPISLSDLIKSVRGDLEIKSRSFLLTFDDGYKEVAEIIAPILLKRSLPAVFFLNSAFVDNNEMFYRDKASLIIDKIDKIKGGRILQEISELVMSKSPARKHIKSAILGINYQNRFLIDEAARLLHVDFNRYLFEKKPYLSSNEIRDLINQGFIIGAHSIDHPLFCDLKLEEQIDQALISLYKLKVLFNMKYNVFAFPHTDLGVKRTFFEETHVNGQIDISFGTSDFLNGLYANNLQRQPMERGTAHAKLIYKRLLSQEIITSIKNRLNL